MILSKPFTRNNFDCLKFLKYVRLNLKPVSCLVNFNISALIINNLTLSLSLSVSLRYKLGPSQIRIVHVQPQENDYGTNYDNLDRELGR